MQARHPEDGTVMNPAESMRESVTALAEGFTERVEFVRIVDGQREVHTAVRRHEGLIQQLTDQSTVPLARTGGNGPSGAKPGSRPPMNMVYANAVDTIEENAWIAWEYLNGPGNAPWTLPVLLGNLLRTVEANADECPDDVSHVARMARKWVYDARCLLGYESRRTAVQDVTCGECGGTLVVAFDATSDVRCIGTASADPCGMVYGRLEWVSLLG